MYEKMKLMMMKRLLQVLHEDGQLAEGSTQLPLERLSLQNKCSDGKEMIVATHALVVPVR
jgi:hypothetical protein